MTCWSSGLVVVSLRSEPFRDLSIPCSSTPKVAVLWAPARSSLGVPRARALSSCTSLFPHSGADEVAQPVTCPKLGGAGSAAGRLGTQLETQRTHAYSCHRSPSWPRRSGAPPPEPNTATPRATAKQSVTTSMSAPGAARPKPQRRLAQPSAPRDTGRTARPTGPPSTIPRTAPRGAAAVRWGGRRARQSSTARRAAPLPPAMARCSAPLRGAQR